MLQGLYASQSNGVADLLGAGLSTCRLDWDCLSNYDMPG